MPAIPRKENIPMDWYDGEDIISLKRDGYCLEISVNADSSVDVLIKDENEVEDFLEWFNSEVRRLYDIEE